MGKIGIRNHRGIHTFAVQLAGRVEQLLQSGRFPLVLGGDCSILLGPMLALRRRGRYGLFFIDGHTDFNTPATSQTGGAAGMDLALVTGRGPDALANLESRQPLVRDEDVIVFGPRHLLDATPATQAIRSTVIHSTALSTSGRRALPMLLPQVWHLWRARSKASGSTWTWTCWTTPSCPL